MGASSQFKFLYAHLRLPAFYYSLLPFHRSNPSTSIEFIAHFAVGLLAGGE